MIKLKVLPNRHQAFFQEEGFGFWAPDPTKFIPPVFNRIGHYLQGNRCWLEYQDSSGKFFAIPSDVGDFKDQLSVYNAHEKPIKDSRWTMVLDLVKHKVIHWSPRFEFESRRRETKHLLRSYRLHGHH